MKISSRKLTSCSRLSERRIASSRLELREELSCPGDVAAWNKLLARRHVKFLKRAERKSEISAREREREDSLAFVSSFFFASHRSVSQRKRGQPMNHEELRDKNYAAIKHDINASCMRAPRSRFCPRESRNSRNEDIARVKDDRERTLLEIKESFWMYVLSVGNLEQTCNAHAYTRVYSLQINARSKTKTKSMQTH